MPKRAFTPGERATAIALARLTTIDQTSVTLNIDRRTIRSWLASAAPAEEADAWRAAQQLAQQQLLTGLATGKVKHPTFLATIAGIAARNIRFGDLIARREARREAEQEPTPVALDPIHEAIGALRDDQIRLFRVLIDLRVEGERDGTEPEPSEPPVAVDDEQQTAALLAYIADLASLNPEQVAEQVTELEAEFWGRPHEAPPQTGPVLDATTDKEQWMVNVTPEPATPPVPRPPVTVLEAGEHLEDHPSWRRWE